MSDTIFQQLLQSELVNLPKRKSIIIDSTDHKNAKSIDTLPPDNQSIGDSLTNELFDQFLQSAIKDCVAYCRNNERRKSINLQQQQQHQSINIGVTTPRSPRSPSFEKYVSEIYRIPGGAGGNVDLQQKKFPVKVLGVLVLFYS